MAQFHKKDGTEATKAEWMVEMRLPGRAVGYKVINVNGADLIVSSFFTGLGYEPEIFETTITGNDIDHPTYHDKQFHKSTEALCLTEHNRVVDAIEAGDPV